MLSAPPTCVLDGAVQLENSEATKAHQLLQLFAYGTWSDYKGTTLIVSTITIKTSSVLIKS